MSLISWDLVPLETPTRHKEAVMKSPQLMARVTRFKQEICQLKRTAGATLLTAGWRYGAFDASIRVAGVC